MSFDELVALFRKQYREFHYLDDVEFLVRVESILQDLADCDDLQSDEEYYISLLPQVREYLQ